MAQTYQSRPVEGRLGCDTLPGGTPTLPNPETIKFQRSIASDCGFRIITTHWLRDDTVEAIHD